MINYLKNSSSHLFIPLTGDACNHSWCNIFFIAGNILKIILKKGNQNSIHYHIKDSFLSFVVNVVKVRMFVPHVSVKVKLLKLSKPTEAKKTQDLLPQVVAEVAIGPDFLKWSTVFNTGGRRRVVSRINFTITQNGEKKLNQLSFQALF